MASSPLSVGFDPRSGWWAIDPLTEVNGDLHDCDLLEVSVATSGRGGIVRLVISIPGAFKKLSLDFEVSSAKFTVEEIEPGTPPEAFGQISATDYAEPNWYSLEAFRCQLEMYSAHQSYEWIE